MIRPSHSAPRITEDPYWGQWYQGPPLDIPQEIPVPTPRPDPNDPIADLLRGLRDIPGGGFPRTDPSMLFGDERFVHPPEASMNRYPLQYWDIPGDLRDSSQLTTPLSPPNMFEGEKGMVWTGNPANYRRGQRLMRRMTEESGEKRKFSKENKPQRMGKFEKRKKK